MKTVKFKIPATHTDTAGNVYDTENAGQVHEVPESDAAHFDKIGWERADGSKPVASGEAKTIHGYDAMTVPQLRDELASRGIEAVGNKQALIDALEADDAKEQE